MHIRRIKISRFMHVENVELGPFFEPTEHSDLVSLAGPNGGGKSSILELIGFALSNSWSLSYSLGRSFPHNAFEVEIAITDEERELIRAYATQQGLTEDAPHLKHITEVGSYWRGFNVPEGEYGKNSSLYNQVHSQVSTALKNHYQRPLGFFLKSDRTYSSMGFNRNEIFNYAQTKQKTHAWSMAFNASTEQYKDIFNFLVQQRYHYLHQLGLYHNKRARGEGEQLSEPTDPLTPYNDLLNRLFPDYEFSEIDEEVPSNLFVKIPSGETIPFHDLSSGEKEVFFVLAFFLRQDVKNAVIIVDEPEMHLHPELARLLVRTMQSVKPGNQIWIATHNPEIIDETGPDRVIYVERDRNTRKAIVTSGADESDTVQQLKNLFGFSGYVGVGRQMVFLEGEDASSDRKMFSRFFPSHGGKIRFVSSQSVGQLVRINKAVLNILENNVGWMNYYLIRDRDYLSDEQATSFERKAEGRIRVLKKYHIENYLLNFEAMSHVLSDIFEIRLTPPDVRNRIFSNALAISAQFLRDMVSFRLNQLYQSEDFSIGRFRQGEAVLSPKGDVIPDVFNSLVGQFSEKVDEINNELRMRVESPQLDNVIDECAEQIRMALFEGEGWLDLFPGRTLLARFGKELGIAKPVILQNSLIKECASHSEYIPQELSDVIAKITNNQRL